MTVLIAQYGVLIVAGIIVLGELGFPTLVPGEIALLMAGSQLVHSVPALIAAALCFGTLDILATSTIHVASRTGGHRLLLCLLRHVMRGEATHERTLARWRARLGGRDSAVVFLTRLIPVFRLYASVTTGLIRIRLRHFLFGAVPASLIWASVPLTTGYVLRGRIQALQSHYTAMMEVVIAVSIAIAVLSAATWFVRRNSLSSVGLRRVRAILGVATVCGATARLGLVAAGGRVGRPEIPVPPLPTLSLWTCSLAALAVGLLWLVLHDIRHMRREERAAAIGALSGIAWIGCVVLIAAFSSVIGVQPHVA